MFTTETTQPHEHNAPHHQPPHTPHRIQQLYILAIFPFNKTTQYGMHYSEKIADFRHNEISNSSKYRNTSGNSTGPNIRQQYGSKQTLYFTGAWFIFFILKLRWFLFSAFVDECGLFQINLHIVIYYYIT